MKYDVLLLEKLIIEIVVSLRDNKVEMSKEHKKFINTNYKQIIRILDEMKKEV